MKNNIIISGVLAITLCSCDGTEHENVGVDFEYVINLDNAETVETRIPISEFCDSVTTIVPEMTERSLLSYRFNKVAHVGDRFYILDMGYSWPNSTVVVEFDSDGRFVRRYGNAGRGPGEYVEVSDFAVSGTEGKVFLLDARLQEVLTYDINDGRYLSRMSVGNGNMRSGSVTSVGDLIYTAIDYYDFDESNYMLRSWNISNPEDQSYYLQMSEYLKGWTKTNEMGHGGFIYETDKFSLFAHTYHNEIFKLTADGPSNYIYIDSEYFFGERERRILSEAEARRIDPQTGLPDLSFDPNKTLRDLDRWSEIDQYFETGRYICFMMQRGGSYTDFLYDKNSEKTPKIKLPKLDLIVKDEYPEAYSLFNLLQTDEGGIFYLVMPQRIPELRTAAQEGMLVDGLDNLEILKQLPDDSNPILFYLQFKEAI